MITSDDDLRKEAAEWRVRLDAGTADEAVFEAWRASDPRRAAAFAQAQAAWEVLGRGVNSLPRQTLDRPDRRMFLRAAAVVGPVAIVGVGWFAVGGQGRAHASTGVGDRRRFEARPGLTVELNTDSRISWSRHGDPVALWLERGEAAILQDGVRTSGAVLHCADRALQLSEGRYNIRDTRDGATLTVLEGAARLRDTERTAVAGQTVSLGREGARVAPTPIETTEAIAAWRRDEIVFSGQTLAVAVSEYNRYLDRKLVLEDPALGARRIGGRFETVRPESFLTALNEGFGIHSVTQGDVIILKKNPTAM